MKNPHHINQWEIISNLFINLVQACWRSLSLLQNTVTNNGTAIEDTFYEHYYIHLMIEIRCALQKRTFSSKTSSLYFLWRVELHMEPHVLLLRARRPWLTLSGVARVLAHSTRMYSTKLKNKYGALCKYGLTHFHAAMSCGWQSPTAPPCSLSAKTSQQCVCVRVTGHTHTHSFWSVSGSSMNVNWY